MALLQSFFKKFSPPHFIRGLNMAIGVAILYGVTLGPGNQDSLFMALTADVYAAIATIVPVSGFVSLLLLVLAVPLLLMLAIIPSLGYIAVAFGTEPSTGKAAALTVAACICFFAMHLIRVRLPAISPVGLVAQLLMAINLAPMYWSTGSPSPMSLLGTAAELLGYSVGTLFLVYFFLVPLPSGPVITNLMAALTGVVQKMGSDSVNNNNNLESCMELDSQAGQLMVPLDVLLLSSRVDLNVYGKPHIFPTNAFDLVYKRIGFLSRLMVHRSRLDRRSIEGIDSFHAAEQAALESIRECLLLASSSNQNDDRSIQWDMLIQNNRILTWEVYSMMKLLVSETSSAKREAILIEGVGGWLVTKTIEGLPACFPHHHNGKLLLPGTATTETPIDIPQVKTVDWKFIASERARATLRQAMEEAYKDLDQTQLAMDGYNDKATPTTPATTHGSGGGFLFRMAEATGFHGYMFVLAFQATGAFLIGCILTFNSTTYNALAQNVSWVFIAVINVSNVTYSGALHKASQRLLGTVIGVTFACCIAAFNYLVAGLSYKSTPTSLALSCTLLAVYTGLAVATREAIKPDWQYALLLATFTPPLLFPYDLGGSDSMWTIFGFRIANNLIGIGLVTVFSLMYPVTTRTYIRHTVSELLNELAQCVDGLTESLKLDKRERDKMIFKHNVNMEKRLLKLDQLREELNLEKGAFFSPPQLHWFQGKTSQTSRLSAQQMQDRMTPLMLELRSRMVELFVAAAVGSWYIGVGVYNNNNDDDGTLKKKDDNDDHGMVYLAQYAQAIRTMRLFVLGVKTRDQVEDEFNALESSLKQFVAAGALQEEDLSLAGRALFARRGIHRSRKLVYCIESLFG
jgi:hypothetical protein